MTQAAFDLTDTDLERFKEVQQLAYACAEHVEGQLAEGSTELQACKLLEEFRTARGVTQYFHDPVAWFGDRTAFANDFGTHSDWDFAPTERKLEQGMPFILDVAPAVDGYVADIGYTCALGDNAMVTKMQADLKPYRALILDGVKGGRTLQGIYQDVDALIAEQGYENRHRAYPGEVLGHRVTRLQPDPEGLLTFQGFGPAAQIYLGTEIEAGVADPDYPRAMWSGSDDCNQRVPPGLWAVEPHLGMGEVGAKWEELLVVTGDDAYWLDDDLPHVRRWD